MYDVIVTNKESNQGAMRWDPMHRSALTSASDKIVEIRPIEISSQMSLCNIF